MLFWTLFAVLYFTAAYVSTFVAQYHGAGRPERIGPVVWQALYFSVVAGTAFVGLAPFAEDIMAVVGHSPRLQELEATYFRCLCFSALPALLTASTTGFFAGRGDTWTVIRIDAAGMLVNAGLSWLWIFGHAGFLEMRIAGAGWATVVGNWAAAATGLLLMFRGRHEAEYATRSGWRFDGPLFRRLLRFGTPAGLQWAIDGLAFTLFLVVIGWLGEAEAAASAIAVNLNLLAFLPTFGLAQAVSILVGQRLGEDRPDLAERSVWTGVRVAWLQMTAIAALYVLIPDQLLALFRDASSSAQWARVAEMVPVLLHFVALYCLFDSMSLVFSFALRGAGDTRYVTAAVLLLSFPVMVLPTWASYAYGWGLYAAWGFGTAYVILLALMFLGRFLQGKWKTMRVIEPVVDDSIRAGNPSPQPPPRNGEGVQGTSSSPSPLRGGGWGEGF